MATLTAVQNNTAPSYIITCNRKDGTLVPLDGCTVTMKLYLKRVQTNVTTGHDACTIISTTKSQVSWQPKTGDLPLSGKYKGDVTVTDGDGNAETLYGQFKLKVRKLEGSV